MALAVVEQERMEAPAKAVRAARDWLRRVSAPRPPQRRAAQTPVRLIALVEIALVLVLAAASAPLFWALFAPGPTIEAPALASPSAAAPPAIGNPFRTADVPVAPAGEVAPANVDTTLDLALHGTWVDVERPSAIIRLPDGAQKTFFVGDEICCGATLAGVYADQVTISRAGVHEALRLPNKNAPAAAAPNTAERPAAAQGIANIVQFRPAQVSGGLFRLQLFAGADSRPFQSAGLRDGDVLVSINDQPAPDDLSALTGLLEGLRGAKVVSLVVERNGVQLPLVLPLEGFPAPSEPDL